MRAKRINLPNHCYHLVSRIAHQAYFFDEEEKFRFLKLLRRVEEFSGLRVIGYCIMSNHVHVYAYLPERVPVDETELLRRIRCLYCDSRLAEVMDEWNRLKARAETEQSGLVEACRSDFDEYKRSFASRMYNVSEFMKTLKEHYTLSFNSRFKHVGTLWESRYRVRVSKSIGEVMSEQMAYVDCNPIKAHIVRTPSAYRWSSYAEALAGDGLARAAYRFVYGEELSWDEIVEVHGKAIKKRIAEIQEEWAKASHGHRIEHRANELRERAVSGRQVERPERRTTVLDRGSSEVAEGILHSLKDGERNAAELGEAIGIRSRDFLKRRYMRPLVEIGLVELTEPGRPTSPTQRYRLTKAGYARTR